MFLQGLELRKKFKGLLEKLMKIQSNIKTYLIVGIALLTALLLWFFFQPPPKKIKIIEKENYVAENIYQQRFILFSSKDLKGNSKYGYKDKNGNIKIKAEYTKAEPFDANGYASVELYKTKYLIDTNNHRYLLSESTKTITDSTKAIKLDSLNLDSIPGIISENAQLEILYLRNNNLKNLPKEIEKLFALKTLDLTNNKIKTVSESVFNLKKLEKLILNSNQIDTFFVPKSYHQNLKELDISGNSLSFLPEAILNLTELERLDVSNNELYELPDFLAGLKKLKNVNARKNKLRRISQILEESNIELEINNADVSQLSNKTVTVEKKTERVISEIQKHYSSKAATNDKNKQAQTFQLELKSDSAFLQLVTSNDCAEAFETNKAKSIESKSLDFNARTSFAYDLALLFDNELIALKIISTDEIRMQDSDSTKLVFTNEADERMILGFSEPPIVISGIPDNIYINYIKLDKRILEWISDNELKSIKITDFEGGKTFAKISNQKDDFLNYLACMFQQLIKIKYLKLSPKEK